MIHTRIALVAVALVLAPAAANAQFDGNFAEFTLQSGAVQPIAEDGTAASFTVGTGVAIRTTSRLRLGAEFAFSGIGIGNDTQEALAAFGLEAQTSMLEYGAFARYHFEEGLQGPYVKGSLGARQLRATLTGGDASYSGSEMVLGYGIAVGWMLQGRSDVATFFEAEYGHAFPAEFQDGGTSTVDQVGFDMLKLSMGANFGVGF